MMACEICKFKEHGPSFIFETRHWMVNLASDQAYLGRAYVNLMRHCGDLAGLEQQEWDDLHSVIKRYETLVRKTFGATLFNWGCLMNNTFQTDSPEPHVHFHVRPRYSSPVGFAGVNFRDDEFGHHYSRERHYAPDAAVLRSIVGALRNNG